MLRQLALATIVTTAACAAPDGGAPPLGDHRAARLIVPPRDAAPLVGLGASATARARDLVAQLAPSWGLARVPALAPLGEIAVGPHGDTLVRLQQVVDGLPVEAGELHVRVGAGGELVAASGVPASADLARTAATFAIDEATAIARANATPSPIVQARARRVWHRADERLIAAWLVEYFTTTGEAERVVLAGDDGRVLARRSLVEADAFTYRVYADAAPEVHPHDGPLADFTPHPTGKPDGSYPALATPIAIAVDGLNGPHDPWLPTGATATTGNNVDAYSDAEAPDGFSAGDVRATITAPSTFDRTYDFTQDPLASPDQQRVGIAAVFFTINWLHDFWYDAGFVEAAGNAQLDNYGRGGVAGDPIHAETQDNARGGSRNNANMSTPDDGMSPRMQVFVWNGKEDRRLVVRPGGEVEVGSARFGLANFDVTGPLAAAADGTAPITDACQPIGFARGTVVLVDRGACSYKTKVANAQRAGAIGVIVANNQASASPPSMGDDTAVTDPIAIPVLSVTQDEGAALRAQLAAGAVTVELRRAVAPDVDGALDASVVAHEHGHYLHHRLSSCNSQMCAAMSEGWADFSALMMILRAGDPLDAAYPIAQYATVSFSNQAGYFGIRRVPYSTTFAIDPLTFADMASGQALPTTAPILTSGDNSEVHNAGEIWATALWEVYVALQRAYGDFAQARTAMARIVVAGLLLAPPDATPTEMRDALIAAARGERAADADAVAAAFARRGLGSCAISPPRASTDFTGIVESTTLSGAGQLGAATVTIDPGCDDDTALDPGETAAIAIPFQNVGYVDLADVAITVTTPTPGLAITRGASDTLAAVASGGHHDLAIGLAYTGPGNTPVAGEVDVAIAASNGCAATTTLAIPLRLGVDDVPRASADDHFDTETSAWTVADPTTWQHVRPTALDGAWHGPNLGRRSDGSLVSPPLRVARDRDLVIGFAHRFAFEFSNATAWDGGVIEVSTDGGSTWVDVSTIVDPGYTGTITAQADNPLKTRPAFVGQSVMYPAMTTTSLALGRAFAGQTILLRFRIGSDANTGAAGWDLDDVTVAGLTDTPFPAQVPDPGTCTRAPTDLTGGCCAIDRDRSRGWRAIVPQVALALAVLGIARRCRRS